MPYTPEQLAFLTGQYRQGQPFVATQGQAIPQEYYRGGQPAMMPIGGDRINWETASPAERDKGLAAMQGRMQSAMKGFALPDVSKYGYSPESQGRVEGAGYLRETPIGIFGGAPKPAGLFGGSPSSTNLASPASIGQMGIETPQAPAPQRRGLFGGGRLADILGVVGDAMLMSSGDEPIYTPNALASRQAAFKAEQDAIAARARREAEMEDWRTKYDYEMKNPKPVNNDTVNDYNFILNTLGKDQADSYLRNIGDRFITTTLPNDQFYAGPQSGLPAALGAQVSAPQAGPQEGATATNPKTGQKVQFRGGQWVPMGGAGSSAPRPFPQ